MLNQSTPVGAISEYIAQMAMATVRKCMGTHSLTDLYPYDIKQLFPFCGIGCLDFVVDWGTAFDMIFSQHFPDISPPILHTTLSKIALEFILEHGGSAYLPFRMIEPYLGDRLVACNDAPIIHRTIYCCYHSENENTRLWEQFLTLMKQICDENT